MKKTAHSYQSKKASIELVNKEFPNNAKLINDILSLDKSRNKDFIPDIIRFYKQTNNLPLIKQKFEIYFDFLQKFNHDKNQFYYYTGEHSTSMNPVSVPFNYDNFFDWNQNLERGIEQYNNNPEFHKTPEQRKRVNSQKAYLKRKEQLNFKEHFSHFISKS
jgi:hypothetical protein